MNWYEPQLRKVTTLADLSVKTVALALFDDVDSEYLLYYDTIAEEWVGRSITGGFLGEFQRTAALRRDDISSMLRPMTTVRGEELTSEYRARQRMGDAHAIVVVGDGVLGVYEADVSAAIPSTTDRRHVLDQIVMGLVESRAVTRVVETVKEPTVDAPPESPFETGPLLGEAPPPHSGHEESTTAWPVVECDADLVIERPFILEVGIGPEPSEGVGGSGALTLPATDFTLHIELQIHGFTIDGPRSFELEVRRDRFPTKPVLLTPVDDPTLAAERRIGVVYRIDDRFIGYADRQVTVRSSDDAPLGIRRAPVAELGMEPVDPEQPPVDVEIVISRGNDQAGHALIWSVTSKWTPEHNEQDATINLGESAADFRNSVVKKAGAGHSEPTYVALVGIGRGKIASRIPHFVKESIRGALQELDHPPTVLLITDDPYVPWELAVLDEPTDAEPPFLGARVAISRWTRRSDQDRTRPPRRPEARIEVGSMAVISGEYDGVPGWSRLVHAESEAAELTTRWSANSVGPTFREVTDCLAGDPDADVIHFALHGKFSEGAMSNGLVLIQTTKQGDDDVRSAAYLDEDTVAGTPLDGHPFVFLNACQVGAATEVLGEYSGLAHGFLCAGACAVIAPLWSVDDGIAEHVALEFYDAFARDPNASAAEILRASRARVTKSAIRAGDDDASTTRLAYQLYSHPGLSLIGIGA